MRKMQRSSGRLTSVLFAAFILLTASVGLSQDADQAQQSQSAASAVQVPAGQKIKIEGVVSSQPGQKAESIMVRSTGGAYYTVSLDSAAEIKEKKSNPFRGAQKFSKADIVPGLHVEVKGRGDSSGAIAAEEVRFTKDDFVVAQTMDTRVAPVENRLGEAEQNAKRLSGQVQELTAVSNAARGGAKAAQETADNALNAAGDARSVADNARTGVRAANERITSLDDYTVKNIATVHFKAGSAALTSEEKTELEELAGQVRNERGYIIEVAGFASADGNEAFNRRLSQKRADAVIQYMAENHNIPLRRFVTPMGYGEKQPVADNDTRTGRKENRRVEVRLLVSKGLAPTEDASQDAGTSTSSNR